MKIEKGIPIPGVNGRGPRGIISSTMRAMKPGDSILLKKHRHAADKNAQMYLGSGNYAVRAEGDGFRVWRTK